MADDHFGLNTEDLGFAEKDAAVRARSTWQLSYGDIITLLITFFIMMLTLRAGQISQTQRWVTDRLNETSQEIQRVIQENGIKDILVSRNSKGVKITLRNPRLFAEGSAEPRPELITELRALAQAIKGLKILHLENSEYAPILQQLAAANLEWKAEIRIEGHTDNIPLIGGSEYRDNWELSAARAQTVMRILQQFTGLPEEQFVVAGFGEYHPIADNSTPAGRELNRRVEVFINASIERKH